MANALTSTENPCVRIHYTYFPGLLYGSKAPDHGEYTILALHKQGWDAVYVAYHAPQPGCALLIPAATERADGSKAMCGWHPQWFMPQRAIDVWERIMWHTRKAPEGDSVQMRLRCEAMRLLRKGEAQSALALIDNATLPDYAVRGPAIEILGLDRVFVNVDGL